MAGNLFSGFGDYLGPYTITGLRQGIRGGAGRRVGDWPSGRWCSGCNCRQCRRVRGMPADDVASLRSFRRQPDWGDLSGRIAGHELAYVCLTRSLKHVPGLEASTLLLVEPVFNPLWTWMLQGERPGAGALLGGALIILSTLAATAAGRRTR